MLFHEWAAKHGLSQAAISEFLSSVTPVTVQTEGASESRVQALTRLEAVKYGSLWRNNAGAYKDDTNRQIRYGLGNDSAQFWKDFRSSDLIGITRMNIQSHHVGRTIGVFTAIEMKHPGWNPAVLNRPSNDRERAQLTFLTHVAEKGGIAGFACDPSDYVRFVTDFIK